MSRQRCSPTRKTSLSYSLSVEFVCNSPKLLSYRFRRRATLAALHSSYAHTRDVADQVVVPSSCSAPGMVLCCPAAAGLGQWSICSTEPASAARCQRCSQLIINIIVQRWWACGGQSCVHHFHIIRVESEDRTTDGNTLQDRACAAVKIAVSSGHGTDAQNGTSKSTTLGSTARTFYI